jgi:hypothetical protein
MTQAISAKRKTTFSAVQQNVTLPAFVRAKVGTAGKVTTFRAIYIYIYIYIYIKAYFTHLHLLIYYIGVKYFY